MSKGRRTRLGSSPAGPGSFLAGVTISCDGIMELGGVALSCGSALCGIDGISAVVDDTVKHADGDCVVAAGGAER